MDDGDFSKRRRNLFSISILIIVYIAADASIRGVSAIGIGVGQGREWVIELFIALMFLFFLWRYSFSSYGDTHYKFRYVIDADKTYLEDLKKIIGGVKGFNEIGRKNFRKVYMQLNADNYNGLDDKGKKRVQDMLAITRITVSSNEHTFLELSGMIDQTEINPVNWSHTFKISWLRHPLFLFRLHKKAIVTKQIFADLVLPYLIAAIAGAAAGIDTYLQYCNPCPTLP